MSGPGTPPPDANPNYPPFASGDAPAGVSDVVRESMDRFERCVGREKVARARFLDDYKFANADAYNGYQWPNDLRRTREVDDRPSLTLNGARQHNLQIVNDAKQNKPGIKILPVADGASVDSAKVINSLVKHIEYISNATTAYDHATFFQVNAGWGYIGVSTDYSNEKNFDQEIYIKRKKDPLNIYLDPDRQEADASDMKFAFEFEDIERTEFEKDPRYSKWKDIATTTPMGASTAGWVNDDYVRIAQYWRVVERKDTLFALPAGYAGQKDFPGGFIAKSVLEKVKTGRSAVLLKQIRADEDAGTVQSRELIRKQVEWKLIIGWQVVEEKDWPGQYIPIVPVWGEETTIEGTWDCKSHTRSMLDAQRMYNYAASSAVEFMGLQTKTPWIAPVEAVEELETYWNDANRINTSVLPYKAFREDGSAIPPPQRIQPPTAAPMYQAQMQSSLQDLLMVSGQYAAQMANGIPRTPKQIGERERQGQTATYHFVDNLAIAIRHVGKIILDLFPHIYDTQRLMQILCEDGTTQTIAIDPQMKQAYMKHVLEDQQSVVHVLNPGIGKYEVQADIGPNYATQREETFEFFKIVLTQAPNMAPLLADLFMRSADIPHAEEAADRLRRMVPPHALGEGPSATEQALMQQVQNLQNMLSKSLEDQTTLRIKLRGKEERNTVAMFDALTKRLAALFEAGKEGEAQITPEQLRPVVEAAIVEALGTPIVEAEAATEEVLKGLTPGGLPEAATRQRPPLAGAKQGQGGAWYVRDLAAQRGWTPVA
jgi:Phage P22-like portal protein